MFIILDDSVTPVQFKLLFKPSERIAIRTVRDSDPVIDDFFDIIDDPRLTAVNLKLKSTVDALNYLVEKGLLEASRIEEIQRAEPQ